MNLVNLTGGNALLVGLTGYAVVFLGLIMLMIVVMILGKVMQKKAVEAAPVTVTETAIPKEKAPGTAGELKLYNTNPRDAAMVMAVVADELKTPLNELRFISIREVDE